MRTKKTNKVSQVVKQPSCVKNNLISPANALIHDIDIHYRNESVKEHEEAEINMVCETNDMQKAEVNDIYRGSSTNRHKYAKCTENMYEDNRARSEIWRLLKNIKLLEKAEDGARNVREKSLDVEILQKKTETGGGLRYQKCLFSRNHTKKQNIYNLNNALVEENVRIVMHNSLCDM